LVFQYASIVLSSISGLILFPFNLKFISIGLYGAWLASGNILSWLTLFDPGLGEIIHQRIGAALGAGDSSRLRDLVSLNVTVSLAIGGCFIIGGLAISRFIPSWLSITQPSDAKQMVQAFSIAVVGTGFLLFGYGISGGNIAQLRTLSQGVVTTLANIAVLTVQILLLSMGYGLLAIAYGILARALVLVVGNVMILWRTLRLEGISISLGFYGARGMLSDLTFTSVARISNVIANNLDSIVIAKVLGNELVPVLRAMRSPIDISRWFLERPAYAMSPALSSLVGEGQMDRVRDQVFRLTKFVIWGVVGFAFGFLLFNQYLIRLWVGAQFYVGHTVNALLCIWFIVAVVTLNLKYVCLALGDIRAKNVMEFSQALPVLPLTILGGVLFGLPGVVMAAIVSNVWIAGWYMPRSLSRMTAMTDDDRRIIFREVINVFFAAFISIFGAIWFTPTSWLQLVLAVSAFGVLFIASLSVLSVSMRAEVYTLVCKFKH